MLRFFQSDGNTPFARQSLNMSSKAGIWTHDLDAWTLDAWTLGLRTLGLWTHGLWTTGRLDSGCLDSGPLEPGTLSIFNNAYFFLIVS